MASVRTAGRLAAVLHAGTLEVARMMDLEAGLVCELVVTEIACVLVRQTSEQLLWLMSGHHRCLVDFGLVHCSMSDQRHERTVRSKDGWMKGDKQ